MEIRNEILSFTPFSRPGSDQQPEPTFWWTRSEVELLRADHRLWPGATENWCSRGNLNWRQKSRLWEVWLI